MKAIRVHQFGGPEVLGLEEVPDLRPSPGQVVVRIHAAGVNPVETYIRRGIYGPKEFPYTPGTDAAGVVESVGEGASRYKPGDRVYLAGTISGAYAGQALCKESQVHPLPSKTAFAQGAAVHVPYATAFRAIHAIAEAVAGETVLIHGATGGVGIAAVQLARAAGLVVIGTGGTEAGRKLVLEQGADQVFDHHADGYLERAVAAATGGRGFDLIIELAAHINLGSDLTALARHGRVVVIGSRDKVQIEPRQMMMRDSSIRGMSLMNASEDEVAAMHRAIGAGLESGSLRPVVGRDFPLADAARAHEAVMESGAHGKIVLIPS